MEDEKNKECWHKIINTFGDKGIEVATKPINKKSNSPCWFTVYADAGDDKKIRVDKAKNHIPSAEISSLRELSYGDFEKMYPIYLKRKAGMQVSKEAEAASVHSSYWYGIMDYCGL